MKRKYILVAAALVVLCAGAAAYSMNQNTELPSSTPNSSSELSSSSVSSVSVSSEPTSSSVSSASSSYQVFSQETTTGTETHPEDQVYVSDEQLTVGQQKSKEIAIQRYMNQKGMTREEAEAYWQKKQEEAAVKNEEAARKREEMNAKREAEQEAHSNAIDEWYRENTGMSRADWLKLSIDETSEWMFAHPDVDFSTSPEYQ